MPSKGDDREKCLPVRPFQRASGWWNEAGRGKAIHPESRSGNSESSVAHAGFLPLSRRAMMVAC